MDQGVNITSFLYDPRLRADREDGAEGGKEGEIPPLITSWVTAPAGRCQNPTLSDVWRELENGREHSMSLYVYMGRVMRTGGGMRLRKRKQRQRRFRMRIKLKKTGK